MKKNILLIFTDQQRWDALAAAGNSHIKTPNLDRLAQEGTLFSSAYTPCPVCVPARCSMHYGQYPMNTGCFENDDDMPMDNRSTMMDVLTAAGYRTHGIGKRHFMPDPSALRGFETIEAQEEIVRDASADDYLKYLAENGCEYALEPHGVRGEAYYVPQISPVPPQHHSTQWIGDRSVQWLEKHAGEDRPFFLFSSFIHPHPPFSPPTPWHKLYRGPDMPLPKLPDSMESLYTYTNYKQNRYKGRDTGRDVGLIRLMKAYYWASVSFIDYQVGRIFQTLEKKNVLDDTLIIFTSDHGEFLGDYNCFGKRSFLDSAARIPMLCRLPERFEAGQVCHTPVNLIDVMPTALAVSGTEAPNMDGEDLAAIADGSSDRDMVFGHYEKASSGMYMAVSSEWKYIWSAPDHKEFLFNRIKDPDELRNRACNVACGETVKKMRTLLQDHIRSLPGGDKIVDENGWISQLPIQLSDDPDAGLIVQDPPCFMDRLTIPEYSN